ncbi:MAG: 4-alpha-glucanotransferase [Pseudomonadota bacterium]
MERRGSGILLHLTSLPSPFGIGDVGPWAYQFADFLASTRQTYWQVLPFNLTDPIHYNSPYHSISAFAGNPLLISPEVLLQEGLLMGSEFESLPQFPEEQVDFQGVIQYKEKLFHLTFERFKMKNDRAGYEQFYGDNAFWLEDFSLFMALKSHFHGKVWSEWPAELRDRHLKALQSARSELNDTVQKERFLQYIFFKQWVTLKQYCNRKGIQIIGDIPIYVDHDSVDVWTNPEFFKLDEKKLPSVVAGVPPDYFSRTGQRWGNPIYQWDGLKEQGYTWWFQRINHSLKLFDWVRIDHFRGFVAHWEIPATEKTAINGRWVEAPAMDFFAQMVKQIPRLPIIAEDLGIITPDVREVMNYFHFPGMKVLLFAFGSDVATNPYAPHNHIKNCVVYTGTHDNNTIRGWLETETTFEDKERLFRYLGQKVNEKEIHWELIRLGMMSVADTAMFPMQDILGLGKEARMNLPGTKEGNWKWRFSPKQLSDSLANNLLAMTEIYGRAYNP